MSGSGKGESLVSESGIQTHCHLRGWRLAVVAVIVVDLAVFVTVDISAHDRFAVCIINLLVDIECVRSIAGHVLLDLVADCSGEVRTAINTLVAVTVVGGQLGDELMVVCSVEADLP